MERRLNESALLPYRSRRNSMGTLHDERTSLLGGYPQLDKVYSGHSHISTIADTYQDPPNHRNHHHRQQEQQHLKSNFLQSVFNSINILSGVGILALPLGFKVSQRRLFQ
jgi:vesicular inhibitory amino acid transporter